MVKSIEELLEIRKINDEKRERFFEELAIEFGYKADKYYSAREKMFISCKSGTKSSGSRGPV